MSKAEQIAQAAMACALADERRLEAGRIAGKARDHAKAHGGDYRFERHPAHRMAYQGLQEAKDAERKARRALKQACLPKAKTVKGKAVDVTPGDVLIECDVIDVT